MIFLELERYLGPDLHETASKTSKSDKGNCGFKIRVDERTSTKASTRD